MIPVFMFPLLKGKGTEATNPEVDLGVCEFGTGRESYIASVEALILSGEVNAVAAFRITNPFGVVLAPHPQDQTKSVVMMTPLVFGNRDPKACKGIGHVVLLPAQGFWFAEPNGTLANDYRSATSRIDLSTTLNTGAKLPGINLPLR